MADRPASHPALRTKQQQFVERILAACREGRLNVRALPNSLLYEHHRHGLRTIAVKTTDLGPVQMETVLRYRLGQYIAHGQIDPALVWQCRWRNEPLSNVHPEDIHVCALDAEVGTILCYLTIRTLGEVGDALMIDRSRPLFPVEKVFGRVYDLWVPEILGRCFRKF